jgi:hypothetical protein
MEQSSVAGSKRRPSMLSLQPPKLRPPQQLTKNREAGLPRTPYPLPIKGGKRSVSFSEQDDSPREGEAKKRKIAGEEGILSTQPYLASFPSLESRYPPASQYSVIPPVALMKVWESTLDQIDWSKVVQEAGGIEKPDTYRNVFKTIVHSHIEELLKQEEYGKAMKIELGKLDDEDADTESGNDTSEEGGGDDFRHLEDNTFLESDESGFGSEDYTDDEADDEEDSDDEDQEDDDCEVINDWVSV